MIAEAIDTVITLGWALLAWIVLTAAVVTLALWTAAVAVWWAGRAVVRAWRGAVGPSWGRGRFRARRVARTRVRRSEGRTAARVPRRASTTTGPSRPHSSRQTAPPGDGGGFPAPALPSPSQARSAPSRPNIHPADRKEAA